MEKEILIGSNSDLIVEKIRHELRSVDVDLKIDVIKDFSAVRLLADGQLVIIDLSVYTAGMIDRIEAFKLRFPTIELIAITYNNDELVDQMLLHRGIDQVIGREEIPAIVSRHFNSELQITG